MDELDTDECACGHVRDEHGGDEKYPGATACNVESCHCLCFENIGGGGDDDDRDAVDTDFEEVW